ncbi:MAG: hypothetical protein WCJ81_08255 [bacterium]
MPKHIVDKLVRDNIVDMMLKEGKKISYRNLTKDDEKKAKILEKLGEKYKELFETLIRQGQSAENITDGLADMLEVMNTIAQTRGINLNNVAKRKKEKITDK